MKTLQMFLLAADKLVRCRWDGRSERLELVNTALEGETLREVAQDAADPRRLYAATLTEIHVSEDGGESWKWLPAGGIDFRDIWTMQAHPTRANELYVGTLPAAVYVSENGGRSFRELSGFRKLPEIPQVDLSSAAAHCAHPLHHFGRPRAGRNPRRYRRGRRGAQPRSRRELGGHQRPVQRHRLS